MGALSEQELGLVDAYWRAANYLSVAQIYLLDNPLLREPLQPEHVKPRLLGHFGTVPGLNLLYAHLNRQIRARDLSAIYITGPGHGGPALVANAYLDGTYSELYPNVSRDLDGLRRLFRQFSFPGGIPSHVAPEVPGSIHEGGELGYALVHAFGAAFDNPDLLVACVVGDGEAETGPLAASWHSNKLLNPKTDGAVLPVLHLNGFKIANPTVLARIPERELVALFEGYGWRPILVSGGFDGEDPAHVHQRLAAALDEALDEIREIQRAAREDGVASRPTWPMLILRTPKGWTGPKEVDGKKTEGSWRSHQVPMAAVRENPAHVRVLEDWLRSYRPEELFDDDGRLVPELAALAPVGERRMSANPHANGGALLRDLVLPDFRDYAVEVDAPATGTSEATRVLGGFLRDIVARNPQTFRLFGPDETASNRLGDVFSVTDRTWLAEVEDGDEGLAPDGRVMEVLSEHLCQGWLEGYLLTGRHGLFNCYEAFIHIVDSMFNQHAKWLKTTRDIPWRRPIASLNYLLSSHVWRQDHNGFSHQDPGFIDHVVNKKAEVIRVYLPPDANTLLSVADHCLRSRNYVNVIVAGKQPALDYLSIDDAIVHCTRGLGIWEWASSDDGGEPDVVLGCAGDVPTLETLAAAAILREHLPELKVRVVNVVDLMRLQSESEHPHGLSDTEFDALFTTSRPVVFAYHGYPWLIHRLTYRRRNHANLHVRGYKEEGTTTTPFDMVMLNDLDRFHLVIDVIDRVPGLAERAAHLRQQMEERRLARPRVHARARRRRPGDPRLDLAVLNVLVVNAGSTSLKLALVEGETVDAGRRFRRAPTRSATGSSTSAARAIAAAARRRPRRSPHIEEGAEVAPLHNRPALEALARAREALPDVPHVAVSDSDFHRTISDEARRYALPAELGAVMRLGFHGLAVQSVSERVDAARVVVCHLGGGCSVTAVRDGRSVDTTMGYTPLEGPPMGTRSGSVDPARFFICCAPGSRWTSSTASSTRSRACWRSAVSTTRSRSPTSPTTSRRPSPAWPPCSAVSTCSPSAAASARTAPTSGRRSPAGCATSATSASRPCRPARSS